MMDAKEYRRHLARLGLPVSGIKTILMLGIDARTSREYARLEGRAYPIPKAIELALRLMVKHGENPEAWLGEAADVREAKATATTRHAWQNVKKDKNMHAPWRKWRTFVAYMGLRPEAHRLARRDQDKPHGPGNSYWAKD